MPLFVVTNLHGPAWNPARGLREQDAWVPMDLLGLESVQAWEVLLGELPAAKR